MAANGGHAPSYGTDPLTRETSKLFHETLGPTAEAFFVFNGTASNVLCLESLVQPHQSILCGVTSHLWLDECGAPERYLGSKLVPVPTHAGKLRSEDLEAHLIRRGDQHFAQPGALSITQPTELGTTYSMDELEELICGAAILTEARLDDHSLDVPEVVRRELLKQVVRNALELPLDEDAELGEVLAAAATTVPALLSRQWVLMESIPQLALD